MKSTYLFLMVVLMVLLVSCHDKKTPEIKTGFDAMLNVAQMPLLFPDGTQTKQPLAYDATGKNWDHHFLAGFTKYIDSTVMADGTVNREYVIFDEYGPGCLYRSQMNAWFDKSGLANAWLPWGSLDQPRADANIRYYFDDEKEPRIDMHFKDFFGTKIHPFDQPVSFIDSVYIFAISYYPLKFQKRLKITCRPNSDTFAKMDTKWYQYTYISYPEDKNVGSWEGTTYDSQEVRDQWNRKGENPNDLSGCKKLTVENSLKSGESKTIFNLKKKGSIVGLKIKVNPYTKETFFNTNIKIYWDGDKAAAVDMPLSYLFGGGGKDYAVTADLVFQKSLGNLFFGFNKKEGSFYSYYPMPFWKSAEIVLENNSGADIENLSCEVMFKPANELCYPKDGTGYFHAKRTIDSDPDTLGYRTVAFQETGKGHVVGIMFYTDKYDMDGDEFTYIDDSKTPQIHGSGTEDDHNQGWAGRAHQKQLWGGLINGYHGAYRIYMNDSYIFNKNILITYEYSTLKKDRFPNGGSSDITIFYYKSKNGPNLFLTDEIDVGNHFSETLHQYTCDKLSWKGILKDAYDGYERNLDYGTYTDDGYAFSGSSRFTVKIDPENNGIKLRKRINRSGNGVQTAEVLVDGKKLTRPWHVVTPSLGTGEGIFDGWYDAEFEIPASFTQGKEKVEVQIRYLDSPMKKEINEFYYWIYCYK